MVDRNISIHFDPERLRAKLTEPGTLDDAFCLRIYAIEGDVRNAVDFRLPNSPYGRAVTERIVEVIEEESEKHGLTSNLSAA